MTPEEVLALRQGAVLRLLEAMIARLPFWAQGMISQPDIEKFSAQIIEAEDQAVSNAKGQNNAS